jgi:hypothetical protein
MLYQASQVNPWAICRAMQNKQRAAGKDFGKAKFERCVKHVKKACKYRSF